MTTPAMTEKLRKELNKGIKTDQEAAAERKKQFDYTSAAYCARLSNRVEV